jgi:hypothetical protein
MYTTYLLENSLISALLKLSWKKEFQDWVILESNKFSNSHGQSG